MAFMTQGMDGSLTALLHKMYFGPSTTKEICESTFSWLHFKVQSTSRNSVMSDWSKYIYCILSPYTGASGMNQLLPDADDWHIITSEAGKLFRSTASKFMTIQTTLMPEDVPGLDVDKIDKTWRKAGVLSDERSIAAMAYILEEETNDWNHIATHWAGIFGLLLYACDYLILKPQRAVPMTNHHFDWNSPWRHVLVERKVPAMLDINLGFGTMVEIRDQGDDDEYGLLKAAIRAKVFLLAENLKTINAKLKVPVPKFPNGSGVKGSVIKEDHARALVRFLFSTEDEQTQAELETEALAALKREVLVPGKAAPEDSDAQEAAPKFKARSAPDQPEADAAAKKARTATTPPTLKNLLPNQGKSSKEVWILRNPKTYGYQIRYPTGFWAST
eukprot:s3933_g3.t1